MLTQIQAETLQSGLELRTTLPPFPKSIMLECSNFCNLACYFCSHAKMTRPKKYIDGEFAVDILQQAFSLGSRELGFNGCGEQFLHPRLAFLVEAAKKIGYKYTYVTTNGSVGSKVRYQRVLDAGLDSIKFSFNYLGGEDEFIHTTLKSKALYYKTIEIINFAIKYREHAKLPYKIYMSCVSKGNKDRTIEILGKMFPHIDEIVHYPAVSQAGQTVDASLLNTETNLSGCKEFCFWPFNKMRITSEGYVNACCVDFQNFLAMGDANTETLDNIWGNIHYQSLRRKILERRLEDTICDGCINVAHRKAIPFRPELAYLPQL